MKKICLLLLGFCLLPLSLFGCSSNGVQIEGYDWKLTYIQSKEDGAIVGCGSTHFDMNKNTEDVVVVDFVCSAESGTFVIDDITNYKRYEGTYKLSSSNPDGAIYKIKTADNTGSAVTANTEYTDHNGVKTYIPTLIITLGEYTLSFQAEG